MNQIQPSSQGKTGGAVKRDNRKVVWIVVCSLLALAIIICLAIFAFANPNAGKPQANAPSQNPTVSSDNSSTPATTPPGTASTPPSTPPSTPASTPSPTTPPTSPPQQTPAQPPTPPASPPSQTVPTFDSTSIISKQALNMTLTFDDMGPGWIKGSGIPPSKALVYSTCVVQYTRGATFAKNVLNMVAVYRSIAAAQNAYELEKPSSVTVSSPNIGDECFLNDSVGINKELVFRKNNVIVWVWVQNDKSGDPEPYARIVLQKISP